MEKANVKLHSLRRSAVIRRKLASSTAALQAVGMIHFSALMRLFLLLR
jgi:hypothetical protein